MKVKLPSMEGVVITIRSDQKEAKKCYENSLKNKRSVSYITTTPPPGMEPRPTEGQVVASAMEVTADGDVIMVDAKARGENPDREEEARNRPEEVRESGIARAVITRETKPKPVEEWLEREIGGKVFKLGRSLEGELQNQIAKVIERHLDAFAWSASDMPGIDPDFLCHHFAMDTQVRPIRQRRRKFNEERRQAIRDETQNSSPQAISGRSSTLSG